MSKGVCLGAISKCGAGGQASSEAPGGVQRISLIIAWWGLPLGAKPGAPGSGPCRALPSLSKALFANHRQTWLSNFELAGLGRPSNRSPEWMSVAPLTPAWVPVAFSPCETPGGECAQHESEIYTQRRDVKNGLSPSMPSERAGLLATSNLPLPGLRFFLRSAEEIQQVYVPQK